MTGGPRNDGEDGNFEARGTSASVRPGPEMGLYALNLYGGDALVGARKWYGGY